MRYGDLKKKLEQLENDGTINDETYVQILQIDEAKKTKNILQIENIQLEPELEFLVLETIQGRTFG